ncbi:MAG: EF-Tu/IF-2/RF-3 family GTPase [Syntrophorhabdaceae bacterium]|nr:EF-Tu/IF-2/RF-3 family GTPase [Syntrophorhabdaceae bacterium]MDD4196259.1 EF-Tu/IF-2/RF-3 family GTPase [Syntrophorhabdaceae bacterium]
MEEKAIGVVAGYFAKIGVAAIRITDGELKIGDRIRIKGHSTDLEETIESMQAEHKNIDVATKGMDVGLKVKDRVREHDVVYILT